MEFSVTSIDDMEVVDVAPPATPDSVPADDNAGSPAWETLTSFVPLLKVLPALSVQQNEYVLNGKVSKESWKEFQSFAKIVKEFCLSDAKGDPEPRVASLTYLRLAQLQGFLPFFPSLRRLQIVNAATSLSHSFLFLAPSLEYLKISGIPPSHAHLVGSFLTTLSDEEGLSLKSLVLGPCLFSSESLISIPQFVNLLSLELNCVVSCWDNQLLESIGSLPNLQELVIDAGDAEYRASYPPPSSAGPDWMTEANDMEPDKQSLDLGCSSNSLPDFRPGSSYYPDSSCPGEPEFNHRCDFGPQKLCCTRSPSPDCKSKSSYVPGSPPSRRLNYLTQSADSGPETPRSTRPASRICVFRAPGCGVYDQAASTRPSTLPSPITSAMPFIPFPSRFKTLRTLGITGPTSLIHEVLSCIASLDLDAVTLVPKVIRPSQAPLLASDRFLPAFPGPAPPNVAAYGDDPWGETSPYLSEGEKKNRRSDQGGKERGEASAQVEKPPVKPTPTTAQLQHIVHPTDERLSVLTSRLASQWANSIRVIDMKPHEWIEKEKADAARVEKEKAARIAKETAKKEEEMAMAARTAKEKARKEEEKAAEEKARMKEEKVARIAEEAAKNEKASRKKTEQDAARAANLFSFDMWGTATPDESDLGWGTLTTVKKGKKSKATPDESDLGWGTPTTVKKGKGSKATAPAATTPAAETPAATSPSKISSFEWGASFGDAPSGMLPEPTSSILCIAACKILEVLDLRGWSFGSSLDKTISDLAPSWPKLTSLHFSVDQMNGDVTISTLRVLALSCPLLTTLEANICLGNIPPIDESATGYALSHPLKILSAGSDGTPKQSRRLILVARHINILFPHVKIETHKGHNAEEWRRIGELVEIFQDVRKDDRDRDA